MSKKFWNFQNMTDGSAELLLYGDISDTTWWGDEVTPKLFATELNALGDVKKITVRINSGGGDVFAAAAIGNLLEQHPAETVARIDGLCASAATVVACHCGKVEAAQDSTYMIHPVKMGIFDFVGVETMKQCIAAIDAIRENIISLYAKKTGREKDEVAEWMDATSWWTGAQAKEKGFVDELVASNNGAVVENRAGMLFVNSIAMNVPFDEAPDFVQNCLTENAANGFANKDPATPGNNGHKEDDNMAEITTVDALREEYPDLVNQIENAARESAQSAERQRMREIDEVANLFGAELVRDAKYEKPCNAQELAYNAARAAMQNGSAYLNAVNADANSSGANGVPAASAPANNSADSYEAIRAKAKADVARYDEMKNKGVR